MNLYDSIMAIRSVSSRNLKEELLKQVLHDPVNIVLIRYTYDPFKKFHIRNLARMIGRVSAKGISWVDFIAVLDKLVSRELSGKRAKGTLITLFGQMTVEQGQIARLILKKSWSCGISTTTINKVYPGLIPVHEVMLAEEFNIAKIKFPCFVSPKIDGLRCEYKNETFYSRGGHVLRGIEHLKAFVHSGDHWDGELVIPGYGPTGVLGTFDDMSGLLRSNKKCPTARFFVFDNLLFKKETQQVRYSYITSLPNMLTSQDAVVQVPHMRVLNMEYVYQVYSWCRSKEYEGVVLKDPEALWIGKRSKAWIKMKYGGEGEYLVYQVVEGAGKYKGMLGAVTVKIGANYVNVGTGFTDDQRKKYWERQDSIVGKWVTLFYMEKTKLGSLRHPVFKTIRRDL